jgi:phosphoribosylformylglycinamidine synthase
LPKVAVIKYPGTNCEEETLYAIKEVSSLEGSIVWHEDFRATDWDAIVVPGGFSYGDYGRAGLIASWSSASRELIRAAEEGTPILGICNGFQVLTEIGLLPGSLLVNESASFVARWVKVRVHRPRGPWLKLVKEDEILPMPIAHAEGRYYHNDLKGILEGTWIEYVGENPNGSLGSVAGVAERDGLILGLMPHPERASFSWQAPRGFWPGGRVIFESLGDSLRRGW